MVQLYRAEVRTDVLVTPGPDQSNVSDKSGAFWFLMSLVILLGFGLIAYSFYACVQCKEKRK